MKLLLALLLAAGLSGCVAYGVPYGSAEVYYGSGSPYYGGGYHGGYYGGAPYVIDQRPVYIQGNSGYPPPRALRDRDRDGVPNRYDRDRDGDGVPNRQDPYPNDPRRR
ncbi:MAG TPA: hypothetical protein VLI46_09805 [Ramlibacter sp.]|nr:hypothetical protein [Ramlibacter sp.]